MNRAAARSGSTSRLLPVLWAGLAVAVAVVAGVLADALSSSTFPLRIATEVTRSAMDVAGIACVGMGLLSALLRTTGVAERDHETLDRRLDRSIVVVGGVWVVVVLCDIAFRAADAYDVPVGALGGGELVHWATSLASGRGLVLTAACVLVVVGCATARLLRADAVPPRAALVAALLGLLTPAVTGHAGTASDHELAVIMSALHVAAASAWVGGLGAVLVFLGGRRALLDPVLPRFSRLATFCIVGVGVTGVLNALLRLPGLGALFTTGYGWLVVAKVVLLAVLAVLGNAARVRLATGRLPVLRWAAVEVTVMAMAIGVAAALTQTA
ncbi:MULTISPECIES: copper resistance D family protein [Pseudonocardia]|uniref:copper resistance D family protein n=1 Tax=Pseudonocardia TaxID=1847 RepID=UPI000CD22AB5|nr:CopD family protein [Pseudonocardia dioxanivorans]GJF02200.1 copper resistance protein CopD [Pseudonocardia sp. D17]